MKMYLPTWTCAMTFAASLITLTVIPQTAVAQDTFTVSSPDGRNKVGVAVHEGKLYSRRRTLDSGTNLSVVLAPGGGQAIRFTPAK